MCSTFEVWPSNRNKIGRHCSKLRRWRYHALKAALAHSIRGAVRCTLLAAEKLQCESRLTSVLVSASTACDFLFCSAHAPDPGGLSVERNCRRSAQIESSWVGNRRPRCARANRCCGSSRQSAPSAVERRRRCPPVRSVSRELAEWKRVYVLVATHGASRPWVSRAVGRPDVALRR
jgi:hypothetical protein